MLHRLGSPELIWPAFNVGIACKDSDKLPSTLTKKLLSEEVEQGRYPFQMRELFKAVPSAIMREVYDDILRGENERRKGPSKKDLVPAVVAYIMQVSLCKPLNLCCNVSKVQSWQVPGIIAAVLGTCCCFASFRKVAACFFQRHDVAVQHAARSTCCSCSSVV